MAIALVNTTSQFNDAGATSLAATAASHTAGNLIVVGVAWSNNVNVSSVTDTAGNSYVSTGQKANNSTTDHVEIWYAKNISGNASNVVTANFSATAAFRRVLVHQYSGCDTTAPFTTGEGNVGTGTSAAPATASFTTATANEVLVCFASGNNATTHTAGASFTRELSAIGTDTSSEDRIVAATGTYTGSFSASGSITWWIACASFKQASTGGTTFNMGTTQAILNLNGIVYTKLLATVKPPQSSMTLNGIVPAKLLATVKPPLGTITFAGIVPTKLLATVKPPLSSMSLTGIVPTKILTVVSPPLAIFRFVGTAPTDGSGTTGTGPKQWIRQMAANFVAGINDHISR